MAKQMSLWTTSVALLPALPILVACIGIKIIFFTKLILRWRFPLAQIPGPTIARWSRFWLVKTIFAGRLAEELVALHGRYGPVVRIGPRHIVVSDAESIRQVLGVDTHYTRGPWFDSLRLHRSGANVISERDPRRHSHLRSILGPGLAGHEISQMEATIDEHIARWIQRLHQTPRSGCIDLSHSLPLLTLDLISHLCLGESFDCSTTQTDRLGFISAMRSGMIIQQYTSVFPGLQNLISRLGKLRLFRPLVYPTHNDTIGVGPTMQLIHRALEKKNSDVCKDEVKSDLMSSFLARGLPREQAESEMIIILAGGTDTTATAAQGVIFSIVNNPAIYTRLRAELDSFCQLHRHTLKFPVQDAMARRMPYLQACIYEGLRKYPPWIQLRERVVPATGGHLHGFYLPAGTFVGINGLATQLDDVYGDDPQTFSPERWLIEDGARLRRMYCVLELVFGYGSSKCLGVKMAYTELNKIVFELFTHFDVSFLNAEKPWKRTARGMFIQSDFKVKVSLRVRVPREASTGVEMP